MKTLKAFGLSSGAVALLGAALFLMFKFTGESKREVVKAKTEEAVVYVEELSFIKGENRIYGTIYKPQDSTGRKPLLIYCHGLGQKGLEGDRICKEAAKLGYVAYNFDFTGGGPGSKSGGSMMEMSLLTEKNDLEYVIHRISELDIVNKKRIFLSGHSLGAAVAAAVAAENPRRIEGLILLAPGLNIHDKARLVYPNDRMIPDSVMCVNWYVGKKFFSDIRRYDQLGKLRKFKGDVLIIHGEKDDIVPVEYAQRAAQEFANADLKVLKGVGHAFNVKAASQKDTFLKEYLIEHKK